MTPIARCHKEGICMRQYRRTNMTTPRQPLRLSRGADGRLQPASETSIGDIWAEQKRIRLNQAIQADQKKAAAKQRGWKRLLVRPKRPIPKKDGPVPKEVVFNLNLPKIRMPKLHVRRALARLQRRWLLVAAGVAVLAVIGAVFAGSGEGGGAAKKPTAKTDTVQLKGQHPGYATILPVGKSITDLGGWARVSPPDKTPVFAYKDTLFGVLITVSQQPLPSNLKTDSELAKLAEQFGATEKVAINNLTAYIGTSIKGPQSVILAKSGLLLLIKSDSKLDNQQWGDYIESLQ
jgi:hypothetical protein